MQIRNFTPAGFNVVPLQPLYTLFDTFEKGKLFSTVILLPVGEHKIPPQHAGAHRTCRGIYFALRANS